MSSLSVQIPKDLPDGLIKLGRVPQGLCQRWVNTCAPGKSQLRVLQTKKGGGERKLRTNKVIL